MISSEERYVLRVFKLQAQQKRESFHRIKAAINEVAHEYVPGSGYFSAFVHNFKEIMELSVDVAANDDRSSYILDVTLFHKNVLHHLAHYPEVFLGQDVAILDLV